MLAALYELLRGFVAADAHRGGLEALARESPKRLYNGLVVVLMRLVFLLYTEDRGMMPGSSGVPAALFPRRPVRPAARRRGRATRTPWIQRYGAWAQLLALFRLVYGGGRHGGLSFAARKGRLFDSSRFPFLERLPLSKRSGSAEAAEAGTVGEGDVPPGQPPARSPGFPDPEAGTAEEAALPPGQPSARPPEFPAPEAGSADETSVPPAPPPPDSSGRRRAEDEADIPLVLDRTVWRVLENLVMLDGERLSYRTLDVEQIGSVYEAIMGFRIELTAGRSIAVRSRKRTGAAVVVDVDELLSLGRRQARQGGRGADRPQGGGAPRTPRCGGPETVEDVVAALEGRIDRDATPDVVPAQTPVLQPTDERRRSGSHYTPSTLTGPIVADDAPADLRPPGPFAPAPDRILDLKVLDPAMGSGAFLVEACRQLARKLVDAWRAHGGPPGRSARDEDELLHARRAGRPALPPRSGQEPDGGGAGPPVPVAGHVREGRRVHLRRPRAAARRLAGRTVACNRSRRCTGGEDAPGRQVEMAEDQAVRRHVADGPRPARPHPRREGERAGGRTERSPAPRRLGAVRRRVAICGDLVLLAFFKGTKPAEREQDAPRGARRVRH